MDLNGVEWPSPWEVSSEDDEDYVPPADGMDYEEDVDDFARVEVLSDEELDYYSDEEEDVYNADVGNAEGYSRAKRNLMLTALKQREGMMKSMKAGDFGPLACKQATAMEKNDTGVNKSHAWLHKHMKRQFGTVGSEDGYIGGQWLQSVCVPSDPCSGVKFYENSIYGGKFSPSGSEFFNISQGFQLHLYDTTDVHQPKFKQVFDFLGSETWTLTDCEMSSDESWVAFSSLTPDVTIYQSHSDPDSGVSVAVNGAHRQREPIYCLKGSPGGHTIYAGTGAHNVRSVDCHRGLSSLVGSHEGDVNGLGSVGPSVIVSGGDDCKLRVWDVRMRPSGRCIGGFLGHTEGITGVDVREDGRHIISNCKDQSIKLWDLRQGLSTSKEVNEYDPLDTSTVYDYRLYRYPGPRALGRHEDRSLMTYFGHVVHQSLVRCHFSPSHSTGQQYITSGSADGCVYIWKLDGTLIRRLRPTSKITKGHEIRDNHEQHALRAFSMADTNDMYQLNAINVNMIKEACWHPYEPVIYASAWISPSRMNLGQFHDGSAGALIIMPFAEELEGLYPSGIIDPLSQKAPNGRVWLDPNVLADA
ncbi:hypothetical protein TRICI_000020 [Trichomonascus ciferrii]|uniref:Uncharacterized protein n=1 Tax=Trichomonascus ciferrii TaxID=44093 RepID=A0A642VEK5_9ASCO|nr:hypothetical protein TRICI_000020 [Trichomonascus ciferrii]